MGDVTHPRFVGIRIGTPWTNILAENVTNERFLDDPPFASGRVVASSRMRPPVGAWDGNDRDVLDLLSLRDHKFASGFTTLPYDGFANLHSLTLELEDVKPDAPLRLLMTGYVNYFSATSLYAAWQAGLKEIPPYVEAELKRAGIWEESPASTDPAWFARAVDLIRARMRLLGDFSFSDAAGFALTVAIVLWQWRQRPRTVVAAA